MIIIAMSHNKIAIVLTALCKLLSVNLFSLFYYLYLNILAKNGGWKKNNKYLLSTKKGRLFRYPAGRISNQLILLHTSIFILVTIL